MAKVQKNELGSLDIIASKAKHLLRANGDSGTIEIKQPDETSLILVIINKGDKVFIKVNLDENYQELIINKLSELGYEEEYSRDLIKDIETKL